uniref:Ubiquitin thioesterase OTU n=1 Tax=Octactis speculum TaxID=3111310 RepID=A0A7S2ASN9_9STRA
MSELSCQTCRRSLPVESFTKSQRKKKEKARCIQCVGKSQEELCALAHPKQPNHASVPVLKLSAKKRPQVDMELTTAPAQFLSSAKSCPVDPLNTLEQKRAKKRKRVDTHSAAPTDPLDSPQKHTVRPTSASQRCQKCDGVHASNACPHYRKPRENHPDSNRQGCKSSLGGSGGRVVVSGTVVRQPGDGSCLFHSLSFGLKRLGLEAESANSLRRSISSFVASKPSLLISDTPLKEWVRWDAGCSIKTYTARMSRAGWGGGIEMAACSRLKAVNIHVFERVRTGYKRISCFDAGPKGKARGTVYILYTGGMHYDALLPKKTISSAAGMSQAMTSQKKRKGVPSASALPFHPKYTSYDRTISYKDQSARPKLFAEGGRHQKRSGMKRAKGGRRTHLDLARRNGHSSGALGKSFKRQRVY